MFPIGVVRHLPGRGQVAKGPILGVAWAVQDHSSLMPLPIILARTGICLYRSPQNYNTICLGSYFSDA
jgi:hypothetical protein